MLHKEIFGLTILAFIVWVALGGTPSDRMHRTCSPISWVGNVVTSITALTAPSWQTNVQYSFDKAAYGCEYTLWRLFYQEEYLKSQTVEKGEVNKAKAVENELKK